MQLNSHEKDALVAPKYPDLLNMLLTTLDEHVALKKRTKQPSLHILR